MAPADDDAAIDIATSVVLAGLAIADWVRDALVDQGVGEIRFSQLFVFARLAAGPAPVGELAVEMGFTHQAASVMVNELEAAGLARRIPNPADRRSRLVELTEQGHAALGIGLEARQTLLDGLFATTTARERTAAAKVVARLLDLAGGGAGVRIRDLGFPGRQAKRAGGDPSRPRTRS